MKKNIVVMGLLGVLFVCHSSAANNSEGAGGIEPILVNGMINGEKESKLLQEGMQSSQAIKFSTGKKIHNTSQGSRKETCNDLKITDEPSFEAPGKEVSEIDPKTAMDPITIFMEVVPDEMRFNIGEFKVEAGQKVIIELENLDGMQHNLLISKPGTLEKVGAAADLLARDPKGAQKHYVPEIPEVLFSTEMLDPGDFATLKFTAPEEPGIYPFVCTFPGHWRMMNGVMIVTKPE